MANNKYNESIEDKAFKALDEALQIDFGQENVPSRRGNAPHAPEANVTDPSNARNQSQEEAQRRRGRSGRTGDQQAPGHRPSPLPTMPAAILPLRF